ncbi:DNA-binding response regulator [Chryseobacterium nematophagum]|uniref:DNA-binding response regulator n=1 Tax=Chryseobacterium nematophagum TaxID=2305228 RepID=A0A3M7THJ9_9FLAO|nr:response regulator transcription factor [Chryseobacterium nematophagum]RNA62139.1 DNA-binding response regulator [Chryseobacterium nematophagum]
MEKRILIADDHEVVRLGVSLMLKKNFEGCHTDFALNYPQVKSKLKSEPFDLILLDIDMPGSKFREMIKEIRMIQKDILILLFSTYNENIATQYINEGANGFLNKLSDESTLVNAINSIFDHGYYYSPQVLKQMIKDPINSDPRRILSAREFEVFELLAKGNGNLEIANLLNLEAPTVGTYKKRVYDKLNIDNIVDLLKIYNDLH